MESPHEFEAPTPQTIEGADGRTTTSKLAYCPIITRYCGDVDCGRCEHLAVRLQDTMPGHLWVCTVCAKTMSLIDFYWADGECDICGFESCVLMLAEP